GDRGHERRKLARVGEGAREVWSTGAEATPRTWTGPPRAHEAYPPSASEAAACERSMLISSGTHALQNDRCRLATSR
ncbi:unnamed protein product, partial [Ectocarpus sp. 12 AP-2014]